MWNPTVPQVPTKATKALGMISEDRKSSYRYHNSFAESSFDAAHVVRIDAYFHARPHLRHIKSLRFHYDDRLAIPKKASKDEPISFYLDGPRGERVCGLRVLWSISGGEVMGFDVGQKDAVDLRYWHMI